MLTGSPPTPYKNQPTLKFVDMSLLIQLDLVFGNILEEAGKRDVQTHWGWGKPTQLLKNGGKT